MLKLFVSASLILLASAVHAQAPVAGTVVPASDIQAFIDALPKNAINDLPIRVVDVGGYKVGVFGVFRPKAMPSEASLHETTVSEVYYVLQGAGTLVTGGTLINERRTAGSTTVNGTGIQGGVSRRLVKGDVVVIPNHVAHWWSSLEEDISYLIIRPDPAGTLTLK
jgi:mannose-6-phosphate isomerase-like protein (cupin superfamily)